MVRHMFMLPESSLSLLRDLPTSTPLSLPPIFPRLPLECSCAWAPGAIGDATRKKMDTLGEQYAEGLQEMVMRIRKEVAAEQGDKADFGIVWLV